jgi:ZIP family zinc transporter
MLLLSLAEMWIRNAMEHGWPGVTGAAVCGALLYQVIQPFLPDFEYAAETSKESSNQVFAATAPIAIGSSKTSAGLKSVKGAEAHSTASGKSSDVDRSSKEGGRHQKVARLRSAELLRLGLLMAFTMTLHNLPEGFAVAFSAFTDFGPVMAAAIAVHNIPEGVIVAAPVYAATGSRWKALAVATLSGLSEPFGALIALLLMKPFLMEETLQYLLAFVGGIMAAVCVLELWPEGRKCRSDGKLVAGIVVGAVVMGWTLWVGV